MGTATFSRVLLKAEPDGVLWAWVTAANKVDVSVGDTELLRQARLLLTALQLTPRGEGDVKKIHSYEKVRPLVKKVAITLFKRGYWNPRTAPHGLGQIPGRVKVETRQVSRMVKLTYIPVLQVFAPTDFNGGFLYVNPRDINRGGAPDGMARIKQDFFSLPRFRAGRGLSLGQPLYRTAGGHLSMSWVKRHNGEISKVAPVDVFEVYPQPDKYAGFSFRDTKKIVQVDEPEALSPEVRITPEDFPESVRKDDPWFFGV